MQRLLKVAGAVLVAVSLFSIVQSLRELWWWEHVRKGFEEVSHLDNPFVAGGHAFLVRDNLPTNTLATPETSQDATAGTAEVLLDGRPLSAPAFTMVRPALKDLGRYHLWLDAWSFVPVGGTDTVVLLARRLQPDTLGPAKFEVTTVRAGAVEQRVLSTRQLTESWPVFRGTQFVREDGLIDQPFSLSVLDLVIFPPLLVAFPIGTLLLGVWFLRVGKRAAA